MKFLIRSAILALSVFALLYGIRLKAQDCSVWYDYSNSSGWVYVNQGYPHGGAPPSQTGSMSVSGGSMNWNKIIDGGFDSRYYHALGEVLCDSWVSDFDLTLKDGSHWHDVAFAHYVFCLTSGTLPPAQNYYGSTNKIYTTDQYGIMVFLGSDVTGNYLQVQINDPDTTPQILKYCRVNIPWKVGDSTTTYHVRLEGIKRPAVSL